MSYFNVVLAWKSPLACNGGDHELNASYRSNAEKIAAVFIENVNSTRITDFFKL